MKAEEVLSDFQFLGHRVKNFKLDTQAVKSSGEREDASFDFDYNVVALDEHNEKLIGIIEFIVRAKATTNRGLRLKTILVMEGGFSCNEAIKDKFQEMLEINGLVTLSQISRSYLMSVTSQSGVPPLRMPMINVKMLREKKEDKLEVEESKGRLLNR